ncbi:MaoC domain protein dehydratase [Segniliparus rotundus DSM 44985]|uniref:MaoC domain protein dehydratase n=1 Tax=Segniliparus rotundus (strain ATCC BAA-972 / CDC 1076 / CIP 108378 / DSM 44985 / JCM 13578) TaxID=640132 RepID=D6ZCX5_SEGRD|nr:MaoC/PaaZ C-terminal domain-containing protein [Segniliparus rotundus]ADG99162.1 MaoC domain protein dehydratase [Segniliparus rotundus DSM 44985]
MAARSFDDVQVGDELPAELFRVTRGDLVNYAGVVGDANPIHFHEEIAAAGGFETVIAHGMLTMGYASTFVTSWLGDGAGLLEFEVRFVSPVLVPANRPAELEFSGKVKSLDPQARRGVIQIAATSAGKKVFGKSLATVQFS